MTMPPRLDLIKLAGITNPPATTSTTTTAPPAQTDYYYGPSLAEIMLMQSDGVKKNYAQNMAAYQAWVRAHPGMDPTARPPTNPTPPPVPATPVDNTAAIALAREAARSNVLGAITDRGLNPNDFTSLLDRELTRLGGTYTKETDPTVAYSDINSIINNVTNTRQDNLRSQYGSQVDQQFGPGYSEKALNPSLLDDAINSILGEQRGNAQQYLDRGKARGIYNDVGYSAGRRALDSAAQSAQAQLGGIEHNVLDKYRSSLDNVTSDAYNAAGNFTLGRQFSLDPYIRKAGSIAGDYAKFGAGDVRSAIGGTNYFDFPVLANAAGAAQGALNLRDTDVATALAERRRRDSARRGLGSQGVF